MPNITKVYLLNVPLESDYKNTLHFDDVTAQHKYFAEQTKHTYENFSYQRKDNIIRIPAQLDDLWDCNYVMYQNPAYNDKWFYAFIIDMEYINDERTDIKIQTDCIQTWYFDYRSKPCFVEREHVCDDTIGINTIPEGLESGEYIVNSTYNDNSFTDLVYVLVSTLTPGEYSKASGMILNGIYSSFTYTIFSNDKEGITALNTTIQGMTDAEDGANAIQSVFIAPRELIFDKTINGQIWIGNIDYDDDIPVYSSNIKPYLSTNFDGYSNIQNNKLLTFPYTYTLVSNNNGGYAIYHNELFNGDMEFTIKGCLTPGCSIRLIPKNYKNTTLAHEDGLNLGKFPIVNWTSDIYTNWLTQNSVNMSVQGVASLGAIAGGVATGNVVSVGMGLQGVGSIIGEMYAKQYNSIQVGGNINCGDVITASGLNNFMFYRMSIKPEFARVIDRYFSMYGYKVNRIKKPYYNHRSRYWFTKCIDYDCDGAIPNKDLQVIKDCYNRGITFWRKAEYINDYETQNTITTFIANNE